MLSFLNVAPKLIILFPIITVTWAVIIGGTVSEMPFGMQPALQMLADSLASLINIMPWLEVVFDVFIYGLQIKLLLLGVQLFQWILGLIVQN